MTREEREELAKRVAKAKALRQQAARLETNAYANYQNSLHRWRELLTRAAKLEAGEA